MPQPSDSFVSVPIQNIMNVVNTHLQWKAINGPPRSNLHYHPSSFGKCLRKAQYELFADRGWITSKKDKKPNETLRIFDTGHTMHSRWAKYFEDIGVLRGRWHCSNQACHMWDDDGNFHPGILQADSLKIDEFPKNFGTRRYGYEEKIGVFKPQSCICGSSQFHYHEVSVVDEDLNFAGHADQILDFSNFDAKKYSTGNAVPVLFNLEELPKKPIVIDMKTINGRDFDNKIQTGMHFEYKVQLTIYINVLGVDRGVLIYENKDNCRVRAFEVKRNPEMWAKIQEQARTMKSMIEEKRLPPPRPVSKTATDCRYCAFQSKCHGEDGSKTIWDHPNLDDLRKKFYGDFG